MRRTAFAFGGATLVALVLGTSPAPAAAGTDDRSAPPERTDRLFPGLGNAGYDVERYDLDLRMTGRMRDPLLGGRVSITLRTTKPLRRVSFDLVGGRVGSASVDGVPAGVARAGEKLIVTPETRLASGSSTTIEIRYSVRPHARIPRSASGFAAGWSTSVDGVAFTGQPDRGHAAFPCNDLPSDAAAMSFRLSVPRGLTAIANGALIRRERVGRRTIFSWRLDHAIPPELTALGIGRFRIAATRPEGRVKIRHAIGARVSHTARDRVHDTARELRWLTDRLGPYPFEQYGVLLVPGSIDGSALETATMSTFASNTLDGRGARGARGAIEILAHELVHQWFGDWVRPRTWSDLWLNEGHATYWGTRYSATVTGTIPAWTREFGGYRASRADHDRAGDGPPARPRSAKRLFGATRYEGGALVLLALERRVGEARFLRIERRFLRRFGGSTATTGDYIDTAVEVAGPSIRPFLERWLYAPTTPVAR